MTLVRWNPTVTRKDPGMDNFLDGFFGNFWNSDTAGDMAWRPRTDVSEENDAYQVAIDLPGVKKDDIKIVVEDGVLTVSGERKQQTEEKVDGYRRLERSFGAFQRSFRLPKEVEIEKIESHYESGVLSVRVPKSEKALPRQIEVKVR